MNEKKSQSPPKVTIVTAVYNAESVVREAIESVLAQKCESIEYILVDGGSSDSTVHIAREYGGRIDVLLSEPDHGVYDAMNKGMDLATGDIVGFLNADDVYADGNVIQKVVDVFADGLVQCCYGDLVYFRGHELRQVTRLWRSGYHTKSAFLWGWMPPHPTFFVRRSLLQRLGGFRLDMGTAADYELMLRLMFKHEAVAKYIPEVMVYMREGGLSNRTLANRMRANAMDSKAWRVNELTPMPWTRWMKPMRKLSQFFV